MPSSHIGPRTYDPTDAKRREANSLDSRERAMPNVDYSAFVLITYRVEHWLVLEDIVCGGRKVVRSAVVGVYPNNEAAEVAATNVGGYVQSKQVPSIWKHREVPQQLRITRVVTELKEEDNYD